MISKLTIDGYARKARHAIAKHGGSCAVISTDAGLKFISVRSIPDLLVVYDSSVPEDYLLADAEEFGLRDGFK